MGSNPLYILGAFGGDSLAGNPAAVCPLDDWLEDSAMQALANRLALSETVYFGSAETGRRLPRWFTPQVEGELCGLRRWPQPRSSLPGSTARPVRSGSRALMPVC